MMLGLFLQKRKLGVWKKSLRKGKLFSKLCIWLNLNLWTPSKTLYKIYLIRAIAQFVVKNIFLKSCHRGQLRLAGLNV